MRYNNMDTVGMVYHSIKVTDIPMLYPSVIDSIGDQYLDWHPKNPVFIDAPTGSGKTTFVYRKLVQDAFSQNRTVLLVSNRIALSLQQKNTIAALVREIDPRLVAHIPENIDSENSKEFAFIGPVCVATYQGLFSLLNQPSNEVYLPAWLNALQYAVFDEVHFLYSDALFNPICSFLLQKIPVVFRAVIRIYMTATSWEVFDLVLNAEKNTRLIRGASNLTPMEYFLSSRHVGCSKNYTLNRYFYYYHRDADYSSYRLHFFDESQYSPSVGPKSYAEQKIKKKYLLSLLSLMDPVPSADNKWLIFVDKKNSGEALHDVLTKQGVTSAYIDSKTKKPYSAWKKLIEKSMVDQSVLVATPVIECGVNILDPAAKHVSILNTDRTSFIQLIGRKRRSPDEIVDLWVWIPSKDHFEGMANKIKRDLLLAYELLQNRSIYKNQPEPYAKTARELWDSKESINCTTLFYIDNQGLFNVNRYVLSILKRRLNFIYQFIREENPLSFQRVVEEWLGIKGTLEAAYDPRTGDSSVPHHLLTLLSENSGKELSEDGFIPIRQAILAESKKRNLEYIAPKRENHASAKTLNPILEKLGLPYTVKKQAKIWTIHPTPLNS